VVQNRIQRLTQIPSIRRDPVAFGKKVLIFSGLIPRGSTWFCFFFGIWILFFFWNFNTSWALPRGSLFPESNKWKSDKKDLFLPLDPTAHSRFLGLRNFPVVQNRIQRLTQIPSIRRDPVTRTGFI
jgi:hypothetical protein